MPMNASDVSEKMQYHITAFINKVNLFKKWNNLYKCKQIKKI